MSERRTERIGLRLRPHEQLRAVDDAAEAASVNRTDLVRQGTLLSPAMS